MSSKKNVSKKPQGRDAAPCFKPIASYWWNIDWYVLLTENYPVLKLKLDDTEEDWALITLVDTLSIEIDVDFVDAASWILQQALEFNFYTARQMAKGKVSWDPQIQYQCRVMALLLCFWENPEVPYSLDQVDQMIWCLLATEDELLAESASANIFPC